MNPDLILGTIKDIISERNSVYLPMPNRNSGQLQAASFTPAYSRQEEG